MANGIITTGSAPKALWPGIYAWWGQNYNEHGMQYRDLYEIKMSDKAFEEIVEIIGFGLAPEKEQGTSVQYASWRQGFVNRFTNKAFALGFIVTREELADNLYEELVMDRTQRLAFSLRTTKEIVGANVYNRAFDSNFAFGDGVELISNAHVTDDGTQSNILAVAADLSEAAIEDLAIQISNAKDSAGLQIAIKPTSLIIPTAEQFNAERILGSVLQNDSANNAINALRSMSVIPEGWKMNNYLTDTDAWFIRTNVPKGMCWFQREEIDFSEDNDFDTDNMKYKGYERYIPGVGDFRGIFGSPGS